MKSEYIIPILAFIWSGILLFGPFEAQALDVIIGAIFITLLIINNILNLGKAQKFQLILGILLILMGIIGFLISTALLRISLILNNGIILVSFPLALTMRRSGGGTVDQDSEGTRSPSPTPEPEPSGGPEPI